MRQSVVSGVDGVNLMDWPVSGNTIASPYLLEVSTSSSTTWLGGPFMSDEGDLLRRMVIETCAQQDLMKRLPGCRKANWEWFITLKVHDVHLLKRASYRVDKGTRPKRAFPRRLPGFRPVKNTGSSCRSWMTGRPRRS
jgi:hypothetical protein